MSDFTEFYLAGPSAVAELDLIEISHPDFLNHYYIVRNAIAGVTVTLEDNSERTFDFFPMNVRPMGFRDDLDQGFSITIGDTGDTLPDEIDRVYKNDGFMILPDFKYRSYRSDDLSAPLFGPVKLVIEKVTMGADGATFDAVAPSLNRARTGEIYRLDRFPMLRGLL